MVETDARRNAHGRADATPEDYSTYIGREGESVTTLRPSGIAKIDGVRLDVISEAEFIPPHTPIKVIAVEGVRIIVVRI